MQVGAVDAIEDEFGWISFNSLRTGKCFARYCHIKNVYCGEDRMFQFPTNGKVLCKLLVALLATFSVTTVSIPYERESALQAGSSCAPHRLAQVSIPYERESALQDNVSH